MTVLDYQIPVLNPHGTAVREDDLPPPDDPFFYGWRDVFQPINGSDKEEWIQIPLTLEDVLHPQLGDVIVQDPSHDEACDSLRDGLKRHLAHEPQTLVYNDVGIDWGIAGIKPVAPDISVIRNATTVFPTSVYYVKKYGGRVDLVIEVTSRNTWKVDIDGWRTPNKFELYAQFGVQYYIIVDVRTHRFGHHSPPLIVYRLGLDGQYEQQQPDDRGWYWIDTVELWIGPYEDWVSWYDADGNKIGTYIEEKEGRLHEAQACKVAEERAQYEADARHCAEEQARAEAEARQREAELRQRAEERIRELEALIRATRQDTGE